MIILEKAIRQKELPAKLINRVINPFFQTTPEEDVLLRFIFGQKEFIYDNKTVQTAKDIPDYIKNYIEKNRSYIEKTHLSRISDINIFIGKLKNMNSIDLYILIHYLMSDWNSCVWYKRVLFRDFLKIEETNYSVFDGYGIAIEIIPSETNSLPQNIMLSIFTRCERLFYSTGDLLVDEGEDTSLLFFSVNPDNLKSLFSCRNR